MEDRLYFYKLRHFEVYDGDTLRNVSIDIGFRIHYSNSIRIEGIDCPEISGSSPDEASLALEAKWFVEGFLRDCPVFLHSVSIDKYGRVLGKIYNNQGESLSEALLNLGLAVSYNGGSRIDWDEIFRDPSYIKGQRIKIPKIKVDLNNSTKKELQLLTGVGPKTSEEIIRNRPFSKLEDLLGVSGIGDKTLSLIIEQNKCYI
jgi:competence ComEA-like helix-hairpin-helix protein